ncbi:hypothetical protein EDC22_101458 [Tepidamorphus gemmatus]|uniref:Uncharacterized protein n=1 Tax=Tepidamorphus gemmatus TaxID=747076 RepID=A0A4R3MLC1_9HYPH|nr:hypothetical protein EDC22_101458 [Tepidamorphus gemmatus]
MLRLLFRRRGAYVWRPALDLRDGRIAAALMTFAPN